MPGYIFSTSEEGIWVHLYDACRLDWRLHDGAPITLAIETRYPWEGTVDIEVSPEAACTFALNLRIPGWCTEATIAINGRPHPQPVKPGSYCSLQRAWNPGDRVRMELAMPVMEMAADKRAADFQDKVALMRGPLVYCFESVDQPDREAWDVRLPPNSTRREHSGRQLYESVGEPATMSAAFEPELLGGVTALHGTDACGTAPIQAIPFFAWANRGPSAMRVWVS